MLGAGLLRGVLASVQRMAPRCGPVVGLSSASRVLDSGEEPLRPAEMTDEEVMKAVVEGKVKFFDLENELDRDFERAVDIRRRIVDDQISTFVGSENSLDGLPFKGLNYEQIHGQNAENVVGYVPVPVGVAGPLMVDSKVYQVPLATTEGALVASTARGCKAITLSGGATTVVTRDAITRAPVLRFESLRDAHKFAQYVDRNLETVRASFESTSNFAKLRSVTPRFAGNLLFLRFAAYGGRAMGMNMVGKGVEKALNDLAESAPIPFDVVALSGNVCCDKKASAVNWIEGRGKSVSAEAIIKGDVVRNVLKTSVKDMTYVNYAKNLVGSAVAGSIGGQNAHASNIVTAAFIAAGQDPAQNVESSSCLVTMEDINDGQDLYISVNMPSLEVGTIGGGTSLPAQAACLKMMGVGGPDAPDDASKSLASVIASTVMAGELSLCAALASGALIKSHLALNRAKPKPE